MKFKFFSLYFREGKMWSYGLRHIGHWLCALMQWFRSQLVLTTINLRKTQNQPQTFQWTVAHAAFAFIYLAICFFFKFFCRYHASGFFFVKYFQFSPLLCSFILLYLGIFCTCLPMVYLRTYAVNTATGVFLLLKICQFFQDILYTTAYW